MPAYIAEPPFVICPSCAGLPMHIKGASPHWSTARIDFTYECSDCGAEAKQTVTKAELVNQVPPLYISSSMARGFVRRGCWEMTTLAPRASRSAIMALLSNALSAISASKANPSISGGTPTVSKRWPSSNEAHEITQRIGERQDFGGHAAFRAANGLALRPPFAPWPWR